MQTEKIWKRFHFLLAWEESAAKRIFTTAVDVRDYEYRSKWVNTKTLNSAIDLLLVQMEDNGQGLEAEV